MVRLAFDDDDDDDTGTELRGLPGPLLAV